MMVRSFMVPFLQRLNERLLAANRPVQFVTGTELEENRIHRIRKRPGRGGSKGARRTYSGNEKTGAVTSTSLRAVECRGSRLELELGRALRLRERRPPAEQPHAPEHLLGGASVGHQRVHASLTT